THQRARQPEHHNPTNPPKPPHRCSPASPFSPASFGPTGAAYAALGLARGKTGHNTRGCPINRQDAGARFDGCRLRFSSLVPGQAIQAARVERRCVAPRRRAARKEAVAKTKCRNNRQDRPLAARAGGGELATILCALAAPELPICV